LKVILLEDVKKLGKKGAVLTVSDGYARNFLLPRKLAQPATDGRLALLATGKEEEKKKAERDFRRKAALRDELKEKSFRIKAKSGESGKLFGSVTPADIASAVQKKIGADFDKRWIRLEDPIRSVGIHQIPIRLGPGIEGTLTIEVVPEE